MPFNLIFPHSSNTSFFINVLYQKIFFPKVSEGFSPTVFNINISLNLSHWANIRFLFFHTMFYLLLLLLQTSQFWRKFYRCQRLPTLEDCTDHGLIPTKIGSSNICFFHRPKAENRKISFSCHSITWVNLFQRLCSNTQQCLPLFAFLIPPENVNITNCFESFWDVPTLISFASWT